MSEYLSDQGKRTHLLDYLASLYDNVADLSGVLLALDEDGMTEGERSVLHHRACTHAMNVLGDWAMVDPMVRDLFNDCK